MFVVAAAVVAAIVALVDAKVMPQYDNFIKVKNGVMTKFFKKEGYDSFQSFDSKYDFIIRFNYNRTHDNPKTIFYHNEALLPLVNKHFLATTFEEFGWPSSNATVERIIEQHWDYERQRHGYTIDMMHFSHDPQIRYYLLYALFDARRTPYIFGRLLDIRIQTQVYLISNTSQLDKIFQYYMEMEYKQFQNYVRKSYAQHLLPSH